MTAAERVLLTPISPAPADWQAVAGEAVLRVMPGAAAQIERDGRVLATVLVPREILAAGEQRRLLGVEHADRAWWTDVVVHDPAAAAILERAAARWGGVLV